MPRCCSSLFNVVLSIASLLSSQVHSTYLRRIFNDRGWLFSVADVASLASALLRVTFHRRVATQHSL